MAQQGTSLCVLAPAKLNLSLAVLGRGPDGFHLLETVMLSIRLYDSLRVSPLETNLIELICRGVPRGANSKSIPLAADDKNLVLRAAHLLKSHTGSQSGAAIELTKRIPMEAGLGGGSSDAAATLVALNRFWKLGLTSPELHSLAAQLGSDVNFFLDSHIAAECIGRGEQVTPVPVSRPLHFVIVKPPFGLSTGNVFRQWGTNQQSSPLSVQQTVDALKTGRLDQLAQATFNDLTAPAATIEPKLAELLSRLQRENVVASGMSGSGSSCFALCRNSAHARTVAGRLRQLRLGQVFAVSSGV